MILCIVAAGFSPPISDYPGNDALRNRKSCHEPRDSIFP